MKQRQWNPNAHYTSAIISCVRGRIWKKRLRRTGPRATAVALTLLLSAYARQEHKPASENPLTQEISDYEDGQADFSQLLFRVSSIYGLPIGVELDDQQPDHSISVKVHHGTVRDVVNSIVTQALVYKWVQVNGVVNVMPKQEGESVLDLKIARFQVRNASASDLREAVVSLPEVKGWLHQNRVSARSIIAIISSNQGNDFPRAYLDLNDVSLREIMNKIVKAPGFHIWSFARYGQGKQYLSISIG